MKTIYYPNTQKSSPLTYWFTNQISVFVPDYSRAYNEIFFEKALAFITRTIKPISKAAPCCNKCQDEIGETFLSYSKSRWLQTECSLSA